MRGRIFPLLLCIISFSFVGFYPIEDPDFFFHEKSGSIIIDQGRIPQKEVFSFLSEGKEWINHEWLFNVVIAFIYKCGGGEGVVIFKIALIILIVFILFKIGNCLQINEWITSSLLLFILPILKLSFSPRPHLFGFVFLLFFIYAFIKLKKEWKNSLVALIFIVFLLWVNSHGSFPLGILLCFIFWTAEIIKKLLKKENKAKEFLIILSILLPSLLINPYGYKMLSIPFYHFFHKEYRELFLEWMPSQIGDEPLYGLFYYLFVIISLLSFIFKENRKKIFSIVIILIFLFLSERSVRFNSLFVISVVPFIGENLKNIFSFYKFKFLTFLFLLLVPLSIFKFPPHLPSNWGIYDDDYPVEECDFLRKNNIKGNIFNSFNHGGYIEFRLYPFNKIYIDGRVYVHKDEGIKNYILSIQNAKYFLKEVENEGIGIVITDIQDQSQKKLNDFLSRKNSSFTLVSLSSKFALFLKNETFKETIKKEGYKLLKATTDVSYIFNLQESEYENAEEEIERLQKGKGFFLSLLLHSSLDLLRAGIKPPLDKPVYFKTEQQKKYISHSLNDLKKAILIRDDIPWVYYFMAISFSSLGNFGEAEKMLLESLKKDKYFIDARRFYKNLKK